MKSLKIAIKLTLWFSGLVILAAMVIPAFSTGVSRSPQAQGRNNLKHIGINLMNYMAAKQGKGMSFPAITNHPNGLLHAGIPGIDPFFKQPYAYSGETIHGYTIKEGAPMPQDPKVIEEFYSDKVNFIIVKGAKKICDEQSMKYAPRAPYCLKGDFSVDYEN